jgi:predicted nucleic acid-binding Zn ribbon protein
MTDDPRPVGDALAAVRRELSAPDPAGLEGLAAEWESLVGEVLAAHSEPVAVVAGVLRVRADAPAWAGQLRFLHQSVLDRLRADRPELDVTEMHVSVAREGGFATRAREREIGPEGPPLWYTE